METYQIAFIIAMIITFWALLSDDKKSGFVNNDTYFMSGDKNTVLEEYVIQPRIIHKINIPQEW